MTLNSTHAVMLIYSAENTILIVFLWKLLKKITLVSFNIKMHSLRIDIIG